MKQIFLEFGVAENQRSSGSRNTEKKDSSNSLAEHRSERGQRKDSLLRSKTPRSLSNRLLSHRFQRCFAATLSPVTIGTAPA